MKTDTPHGVASACKDCGGWVLFDAHGEVIETWPDGWEDNVCRNFLIAQGVRISGDPIPPPPPMPTQPASYGEPWRHEYTPSDGNLIVCEKGDVTYSDNWSRDEYFDRAIQCVNACQGIADPVKAIQAAREAMEEALPTWHDEDEGFHGGTVAGEITWSDVRAIKAALAQLNGRAGE